MSPDAITPVREVSSAQAFSRAAPLFEGDEEVNPLARWTRRRSVATLDAAFGPGDLVIEIGCGTGIEATHLARRGVSVVATDAAPGMIAAISAKTAPGGVAHDLPGQDRARAPSRPSTGRAGRALRPRLLRRRVFEHGAAQLRAEPRACGLRAGPACQARRPPGVRHTQSLLPLGDRLVPARPPAQTGFPPLGRPRRGHLPPRLAG